MNGVIWIPGVPVAQPRHRTRVVKTRFGKVFSHEYYAYTKEQKAWIADIKASVFEHMKIGNVEKISVPVTIHATFIMPRPKSHYGTGRNAAVLKPSFQHAKHVSKPDWDNLAKMLTDNLTDLLVDDSLIWKASVLKVYQLDAGDKTGCIFEYATFET